MDTFRIFPSKTNELHRLVVTLNKKANKKTVNEAEAQFSYSRPGLVEHGIWQYNLFGGVRKITLSKRYAEKDFDKALTEAVNKAKNLGAMVEAYDFGGCETE